MRFYFTPFPGMITGKGVFFVAMNKAWICCEEQVWTCCWGSSMHCCRGQLYMDCGDTLCYCSLPGVNDCRCPGTGIYRLIFAVLLTFAWNFALNKCGNL